LQASSILLNFSRPTGSKIEDDGLDVGHLVDAVAYSHSNHSGIFDSSKGKIARPVMEAVVDGNLYALQSLCRPEEAWRRSL
jgi:hypothetical protein